MYAQDFSTNVITLKDGKILSKTSCSLDILIVQNHDLSDTVNLRVMTAGYDTGVAATKNCLPYDYIDLKIKEVKQKSE